MSRAAQHTVARLSAALFAALALAAPAAAQTDGSAEPMRLSWTAGSLWTLSGDGQAGGDSGRGEDTVQVYEIEPVDQLTGPQPANVPRREPRHYSPVAANIYFRHLLWEGGSKGCIFTATPQADGSLRDVAGGRDCPRSDSDHRCGAISEGFDVYALAGGSCEQFRVEECGGLLPCY